MSKDAPYLSNGVSPCDKLGAFIGCLICPIALWGFLMVRAMNWLQFISFLPVSFVFVDRICPEFLCPCAAPLLKCELAYVIVPCAVPYLNIVMVCCARYRITCGSILMVY